MNLVNASEDTPFREFLQHAAASVQRSSDPARTLWERLEAFEDLTDSEVGDTTMLRARHLEREYGIRQIYLKMEGSNPTGTQKDRIAFAQVHDALKQGQQTLTAASCGNYGVALAFASHIAGLHCTIYVPKDSRSKRLQVIRSLGANLHFVEGPYEDALSHSQQQAKLEGWYDANPGEANLRIQLEAYEQIAHEIYDELHDAPAVVAIPVSNGTTLVGLHRGFVRLSRRGKVSRIPRMVAGSSYNKNPIVKAFRRGLPSCEDLDAELIRESAVNGPLVNWRSTEGNLTLEAIRSSDGWAEDVTDRQMNALARFLREEEGINILPASTAGLHAFLSKHRTSGLESDRYVILLTGKQPS